MSDEKKPLPEVYVPDKDEYPLAVRVTDYYLKDYERNQSTTQKDN